MQSGGTRDRGVNIVSVPTKSGRLATMSFNSGSCSFNSGSCSFNSGSCSFNSGSCSSVVVAVVLIVEL